MERLAEQLPKRSSSGLANKHHGPPPLTSDRWPNGLLGVSDVNLTGSTGS